MRHQRNTSQILFQGGSFELLTCEHEIIGGHVLSHEDAVHGLERELPPVVKKVREMRLPKAGLPGEK